MLVGHDYDTGNKTFCSLAWYEVTWYVVFGIWYQVFFYPDARIDLPG